MDQETGRAVVEAAAALLEKWQTSPNTLETPGGSIQYSHSTGYSNAKYGFALGASAMQWDAALYEDGIPTKGNVGLAARIVQNVALCVASQEWLEKKAGSIRLMKAISRAVAGK